MPLILPGNAASATAATGFNVENSIMMDHASTSKLTRTHSGTPTSDKIGTFSCWVKILPGAQQSLSHSNDGAGSERCQMNITSSGILDGTWRNAGRTAESDYASSTDGPLFRDPAAWYHVVWAWDTTDGTAADRLKVYVNNTRVTLTFSGSGIPQNTAIPQSKNGMDFDIGYHEDDNDGYGSGLKGYMAEVVFVDGQQLTPSSFGEADEDSPNIWKPKDEIADDITFGTFGFYYKFEDGSNLDTDSSGNSNGASTASNLTQATDTPTNNFATMNPLDNYYANSTFSEGNLKLVQGSSTYAHNSSTIAVTAGKWYVEAKLTTDSEHALVGITDAAPVGTGTKILGSGAYDYSIKQANGDLFNNVGDDPSNDATNYAAAYAQNDIIGIALDCDNNKLYFSKGGAWSDGSGSWDSTTFNASVGAITITAPASTDNGHYFFASGDYGGAVCNWEWNFGGCPPNTISSGNADGNGYGNFEYAPPSGYYALCTKNLAEYG